MSECQSEAVPIDDRIECAVRCAECGLALSDSAGIPVDARQPCSCCGSMSRVYDVAISESVNAADYFTELQERDGDAIGFSTADPDGRTSGATLRDDSTLDVFMTGPGSQGEQDSIPACAILRS